MTVFNQNDLLDYELKYKEDNLVLQLVAALRHAYKQIAVLPENIADLEAENRMFEEKIVEQGAVIRQLRVRLGEVVKVESAA